MKKLIPRYTFLKNKYGSELLVDIVELKDIKKYVVKSSVHTLTYYDITFITEGEGSFILDNHTYRGGVGDVFFSKPGEIRNWDTNAIVNGYALIFEEEFLSSFFKDSLFVQHLSFFNPVKESLKIHLPERSFLRMLQLLQSIKEEIDLFRQNDVHVLRAQLYEALMLLDRFYVQTVSDAGINKEGHSPYLVQFVHLVDRTFSEYRTVRYYAGKLCITPNYLNEIVSTAMQISAKQYIQNKVMKEAKRMLAYTDLPVAEIAFELNYETVSYFSRCFRRYMGETPLGYRRGHKP